MKICALFPGQGYQRFGMLAGLASKSPQIVEPILDKIDGLLPGILSLLLGKGEPVDTTATELAQPLLLAQGYAHYRVWESQNLGGAAYGMGHSLGEFTALVAAGILDFETGINLVRERGLAMRNACQGGSFGMTMLGKPKTFKSDDWLALVTQCASQSGVDVAAFNSPSQTVVSGSKSDLGKLVELLKHQSQSRFIAKGLPVSGAFHSRYMLPAADRLSELVQCDFNFDERKFDVVSNLTGKPYTSSTEIRKNLVAELTNPVRWWQSYEFVEPFVDEFVSMGGEIGKIMQKDTKTPTASFSL